MIKHLAFALVTILLAMLAACDSPSGPVTPTRTALEVSQPEGWDEDLTLPEAEDLNPDPNILEINLVAKLADIEFLPGKKTVAWTYNGTVPGPLLRARVGDRLIVHFKNELPESTTIHWHGVRVPNEMDGAPGMTQAEIESGGTFEYEFTLKDAGTYWYHPHVDSSAQVGRGLYGGIVVEDPNDPKELGDELVLMFSDIGLTESGELLPSDTGGNFGDLFGREGSVLLVNGKVHPTLKVRNGKQQRWRVINAARARYFSLRLRDQRFIVLGGDNGFAQRSSEVYRIVITPGERADLVFTPTDMPGTSRMLSWLPPDRGYGSQYARAREDLMMLETVDLPPVAPAPIPEHLRAIEPIALAGATEHTLNLTIMSKSGGGVTMGINGIPSWDSKPMMAHIGETQVWTLVNDTDFAHPFHLHGFFFQVIDETRVPEWKDTVDVPAKTQLRIAIKFDERPGMWMFHCHILDHADIGMMGHLHVMP